MKSNYQLKNVLENNIKSKYMNDVNGLSMHYLESGEKTKTSELIVLLHGFQNYPIVGEKSCQFFLNKVFMLLHQIKEDLVVH